MSVVQISSLLLLIAFILYIFGTIIFTISVAGKKFKKNGEQTDDRGIGILGFVLTVIGFLSQVGYIFTRWKADGHFPISDLFEYTTFLSVMMILGFIIIYLIYRNNSIGMIALPIAVIVIAYASVFPREVEPLIPALQSNWLMVHVTTVSLGEGILTLSFVAGLVYLVRVIDQSKRSARTFWLEFVLFFLICAVGFACSSGIFQATGYSEKFQWVNQKGDTATLDYNLPAIVGPHDGKKLTEGFGPVFQAPSWMNGVNAPKKFNTVMWSIIGGMVIYGVIRLVLRGHRIGAVLNRVVMNVNPPLMDEISYRAVAIGFPVFTLGGIVFAAIWAEQAWSRFWGWDPKEVWALITFFFYAAYLHFRLSRGWEGEKSAWLSVVGFVIIMFNLIFVNLVIAGLHSYA